MQTGGIFTQLWRCSAPQGPGALPGIPQGLQVCVYDLRVEAAGLSGPGSGTDLTHYSQFLKQLLLPWPGSSGSSSAIPMRQGCRFDPRSGHVQESTSECINKGNNTLMSLSSFLSL